MNDEDCLIESTFVIKHCQTCNAEIETELENKTDYCEYCETEVYLR
jgi:hypothetical protein